MLVVPIDVKTLSELVEKVEKWVGAIVRGSKDKKKRNAVQLVGTCRILLESLRALDNAFRACSHELDLFQESWPAERKEQLGQHISDVVTQEKIIPTTRQYLQQLKALLPKATPEERYRADQIRDKADQILEAIDTSESTPFPDKKVLLGFLWALSGKEIETGHTVSGWISSLKDCFELMDRGHLKKCDEAYGALKGRVMAEYGVTDPG